ncbi:MAG: hypothetical protein ACXACY_19935 [Candidatus Hodarchaeales archaeon]
MNLKIESYKNVFDEELLNLFYKSNFHKRNEFDYVRIPKNWLYRYKSSKPYIIKIAKEDETLIASLGLVCRKAIVENKIVKIGCFVDNCILPEYNDFFEDVFTQLFREVEKSARKEELDIIQGWTFLKNLEKNREFWKELGFVYKGGINCYLGGSDYDFSYPQPPGFNIPAYWKILLGLNKYNFKIRERFLNPLKKSIKLRLAEKTDTEIIHTFLDENKVNEEFSSYYSYLEFKKNFEKNNIFGILAEERHELIGVLTFINTAWSGWMYGIPYYDVDWGIFYSFIVDEFYVSPEYQNTPLPSHMLLKLMKIKDPEKKIMNKNNYTYVGAIFDRQSDWMRRSFLKLGFSEPKFDYGVILAKSLNENIKIKLDKIWNLPPRYILAPVPSSQVLHNSAFFG